MAAIWEAVSFIDARNWASSGGTAIGVKSQSEPYTKGCRVRIAEVSRDLIFSASSVSTTMALFLNVPGGMPPLLNQSLPYFNADKPEEISRANWRMGEMPNW